MSRQKGFSLQQTHNNKILCAKESPWLLVNHFQWVQQTDQDLTQALLIWWYHLFWVVIAALFLSSHTCISSIVYAHKNWRNWTDLWYLEYIFFKAPTRLCWVQIEDDTAKYSSHQRSAWNPNRVWKPYPKTENWPSSNESPPKPDCSNTLQSKQNFRYC